MKRYFKPKAFEIYPKRTLYEFIGINIYKKYLPMTGDLARKWRKIVQIKPHKAERINELYRYERETRKNELRHLIGTAICIGLVFVVDKKITFSDVLILTSINLYVNIYPIFLQRHNRIRIIQVLRNNGYKSPYD
jgi:hypothetical protein